MTTADRDPKFVVARVVSINRPLVSLSFSLWNDILPSTSFNNCWIFTHFADFSSCPICVTCTLIVLLSRWTNSFNIVWIFHSCTVIKLEKYKQSPTHRLMGYMSCMAILTCQYLWNCQYHVFEIKTILFHWRYIIYHEQEWKKREMDFKIQVYE
jgi:hypothetical protein